MSDIKKLIELLLSDRKLQGSSAFQHAVYKDEPIIQPASQMKSYVPEKIRQMKQLASKPEIRYRTEAYIFYRQAKFMADYEDDFEYSGEFLSYFPTYQRMHTDQLRGYFTWRSRVRKGEAEPKSLSFAFLYAYELLHLIGADSPQDAFDKLKRFGEACAGYESAAPLVRYIKTWLVDLAAYYDLDSALLNGCTNTEFYGAISVLADCGSRSDEELFEAICAVSSHNIKNSRLYKACSEDAMAVVCTVYRRVSEYYEKHRTKSLVEKLFGLNGRTYYDMFSGAVFYDHLKHKDCVYEINEFYKFTCKNGMWFCLKYLSSRKNSWLGELLRAVDSMLREKLDFGNPIKNPCNTKWILAIIDKTIDEHLAHKREAQRAKVEIDVSKLEAIRLSAEITRDMLMTDEEREVQEQQPVIASEITEDKSDGGMPLNEDEYAYLRCLLYGERYSGRAMISVLIDCINEKLYDIFSDIVIEFDADEPSVIEDYADELKGLMKEWKSLRSIKG